MATPASVLTALAAAIVSQTGATRLGSDYRTDLEAIPTGATRYQLRGGPAGKDTTSDANTSYTVLALELDLHHRLADPDDERAYTEGAMQTNVEAMMAESFWKVAGVFEVESDLEYATSRVLNVILTSVRISVSIEP